MDEERFDLGTGLTIVTITFDDNSEVPRIDLGDCAPHIAVQIFENAAEILRSMMPLPTITYMGQTIASEFSYDFDEDDD